MTNARLKEIARDFVEDIELSVDIAQIDEYRNRFNELSDIYARDRDSKAIEEDLMSLLSEVQKSCCDLTVFWMIVNDEMSEEYENGEFDEDEAEDFEDDPSLSELIGDDEKLKTKLKIVNEANILEYEIEKYHRMISE